MHRSPAILAATLAMLIAPLAHAQFSPPPIDPAHRFSWQENCGWINWIAGPSGPRGFARHAVRLHLAPISPASSGAKISAGSTSATPPLDGVSRQHGSRRLRHQPHHQRPAHRLLHGPKRRMGQLSGGALASPPNPASGHRRFPFPRLRLAENIGWINPDDAAAYAGFLCPADFDQDTHVAVSDIFTYLRRLEPARDPRC